MPAYLPSEAGKLAEELHTRIELAFQELRFDDPDVGIAGKVAAFEGLAGALDGPLCHRLDPYQTANGAEIDFSWPFELEASFTPGITARRRQLKLKHAAKHGEVVHLEVLLSLYVQVAEARWYVTRPRGKTLQTKWFPLESPLLLEARPGLRPWVERLTAAAQRHGVALLEPSLGARGVAVDPALGPPVPRRPASLRGWVFMGTELPALPEGGRAEAAPSPQAPPPPTVTTSAHDREGGTAVSAPVNALLAAWLGFRPAREALGPDAPIALSLDWLAGCMLPYVTYNKFQEQGLLPASVPEGAWTREARQRAVLAWARALLGDFETAHPGDDGARRRIEAAKRYLLDRRPENDISLGLLFADGPKHPGFELAGLACRSVSDPSEQDLASIFGQAAKRATGAFSSDSTKPWYQADLQGVIWVLRAELVPWAMGLGDPLVAGTDVGERLVRDAALWEPLVGSDWEQLLSPRARETNR